MLYAHAKPAAKTQTVCYHCGDAISGAPIVQDEKDFCCTGCKTVYQILAQNSLCNYYTLTAHPGSKQETTGTSQFDYLADEAEARKLAQFTDGRTGVVTFKIPAIHCSSCIWLLENLHTLQAGIHSATVNLPRREVTIRFDWQNPGLKGVVQTLHKIGYAPLLQWDKHAAAPDADQAARKQLLAQLGVAGFCLGNIMLFSFPEYLQPGGVSMALMQLFAYVSLALSVPLVFFAAAGYLRSAWAGIRSRYFTIDQPLAIGILTMFVRSAYEILSGEGMGYLDSLSGLIFFLLVGKFFQQLTYRHLAFDRDYRAYFPLAVTIVEHSTGGEVAERTVPLAQVKTGHTLVVRNGEVVPTDSILMSAEALVDYSFITGESVPVSITQGQLVYAGGRLVGSRAQLVAQKTATQSTLTQLWNHPAFKKQDEGYTRLVNVISKYFTIATLLLAFASLAYWHYADAARAWQAFTAVLIIACPCALAFATPFAYGHIVRVLGRHGFYLKNATIVEKLAGVDTVVFDKTGTLTQSATEGDGTVTPHFASPLTTRELQLVRAVAMQSTHPLSKAIAAQLPGGSAQPVSQVHELSGKGIEATISRQHIKLGSAAFCSAPQQPTTTLGVAVHVQLDGTYRGYFAVQQRYREGLADALNNLRQQRYALRLLSGDGPAEAAALGRWFAAPEMLFGQQPADKLTYMEQLSRRGALAAMVGDGLNDAGALRAAHVGIAVTGAAAHFTPASDAIIGGGVLVRLPQFLRLAKWGKNVVLICFGVSLLYNLTGVWFAVQGQLSPVIAAILMPFSSIGTILLATGLAYLAARLAGLKLPTQATGQTTDLNQFLG
jgi:Cu+-exporting ATPase